MSSVNLNYSSMYAFVKFYLARMARQTKERISGRRLLAGQFLKVIFMFLSLLVLNNVLFQKIIPPMDGFWV